MAARFPVRLVRPRRVSRDGAAEALALAARGAGTGGPGARLPGTSHLAGWLLREDGEAEGRLGREKSSRKINGS